VKSVLLAVAASFTACKFGGPTGNPYEYVAFPDADLGVLEGGSDGPEPAVDDATSSDVGPTDALPDAVSAESSTGLDGQAAPLDAAAAETSTGLDGGTDGAADADTDQSSPGVPESDP
jgi:hypothetical protein